MIADRQHVLGTVIARRNRDGQPPGIEVGAIYVGHQGVATLLNDHGSSAFAIAQAVAAEIGNRRRQFTSEQANPIRLHPIVHGHLRFDGPDLRFQYPVAAQSGEAGGVRARGDVGASQLTQQRGCLLARLTFSKVATIHEDVGLFRQRLLDSGQFVGILPRHRVVCKRAGSDIEPAFGSVGD